MMKVQKARKDEISKPYSAPRSFYSVTLPVPQLHLLCKNCEIVGTMLNGTCPTIVPASQALCLGHMKWLFGFPHMHEAVLTVTSAWCKGHLYLMNKMLCPQGVREKEVPLYVHTCDGPYYKGYRHLAVT